MRNIVILTDVEELYHKHLCITMANNHNVSAILTPIRTRPSILGRIRNNIKLWGRYGPLYNALRILGHANTPLTGWSMMSDLRHAARRYGLSPLQTQQYLEIARTKVRHVGEMGSQETAKIIQSLNADYVICSGGPVYSKAFIDACPPILNYHTGISPLYNGAYTAFYPFANSQPQLTGGTLMLMNDKIDGGDILAHYFPELEPGDTPGVLLFRSVLGGIDLIDRFLAGVPEISKTLVKVSQPRPFLFYWCYQWSVHHSFMVQRNIKRDICSQYTRDAAMVEYWRSPDPFSAEKEFERLILSLTAQPAVKAA